VSRRWQVENIATGDNSMTDNEQSDGILSFHGIRHDGLDRFFAQSGVLDAESPHQPFLILFVRADGLVVVSAQPRLELVLALPDETMLLRQWTGRARSDFFRFTVGDLRAALVARENIAARDMS
jgi:hypothetical protein